MVNVAIMKVYVGIDMYCMGACFRDTGAVITKRLAVTCVKSVCAFVERV